MSAVDGLAEVVAALEADPSDREVYQAWLARLDIVAEELRGAQGLDLLLTRLAAVRGYAGQAKEVRRMLAAGRVRVVRHDETGPARVTEWLRAAGAQAPDGLHLPSGGYQLTDGILGLDGVVSRRPVVVVGTARDLDGGPSRVRLLWQDSAGSWQADTVARSVVADSRAIVRLADRDVPVDSDTARALVVWLREQEHAAVGLPVESTMSRTGWTPDLTAYTLGAASIGRGVTVTPVGDGERDRIAAYRERGTLDEWRRHIWPRIADHPAAVVVLAGLCAPLLAVVEANGWLLDIGGGTGAGKSTAARLALSCWGDWRGLEYPWQPRAAGLRIPLETHLDAPVVYDDTRRLDDGSRVGPGGWQRAQEVAYMVSQGSSDALGDGGGGTRAVRAIRCVLISTGESPIADHITAGGAARRMLTLRLSTARPAVPGGVVVLDELRELASRYHGTAGPAWVRWLHEHRERWPGLHAGYRQRLAEIRGACPGADRDASPVALLETVAAVIEEAVGLHVPAATAAMPRSWLADSAEAKDIPWLAYQSALEYASRHRSQWEEEYWDNGELMHVQAAREPVLGVRLPDRRIGWYPSAIAEAVAEAGYRLADVAQAWRERGILVDCVPGRNQARCSGGPVRYWYLMREDASR